MLWFYNIIYNKDLQMDLPGSTKMMMPLDKMFGDQTHLFFKMAKNYSPNFASQIIVHIYIIYCRK